MGSNVTHLVMMAIRSPFFSTRSPSKKYIDKGLFPLHARVMCLFDHLEDQFHECGVDNLYMSAKFCRDAYTHHKKVKLHCVTRKDGRGLPRCIIQEAVDSKIEQEKVRGNERAAVLDGDSAYPLLLAVLVYDTKPIHFQLGDKYV